MRRIEPWAFFDACGSHHRASAIDKLLGHGTFAKVYSGQWKNRAVAIKMIEEENPLFDLDSFRIERAVLSYAARTCWPATSRIPTTVHAG